MGGLIDDHFLVVFVDGRHSDRAGHHDVGLSALVTDLVNALAWGKCFDLDLSSQDRHLLIVQQCKERHMFQL
jgi:hypothetical protein